MTTTARPVIPRSRISVGLEPDLRPSFAAIAAGRALVIDYFASQRCSVVVGDLTCTLKDTPPGPGFVALAPVEGVPIFVEARLLKIFDDAGPSVRIAGLPFARHLAVELERPERWIDFLDSPGVLAGKQRFRRSPRTGP